MKLNTIAFYRYFTRVKIYISITFLICYRFWESTSEL